MSVAYKSAVDDAVIDELRAIIGDEQRVLPGLSSRVNRTRVPAPFPVHRWAEFMPDVAVLPATAEEVSEVVKLANRLRIPVVPRAGGTGLADGAVPLRGGICVDVKLMNQIHEIDLTDRTVTVGPGINMLKLNEELRPHGVFYPDDPASYPCSLVGGRIGTGGWSLLGARFGHTRDLVISMEVVLPTGEIVEIAEGGGRKLRKSSTGLTLKQLFTGHQGTLGITTEATLELVPRPEARVLGLLRLRGLHERLPHHRCPDQVGTGDAGRGGALRRVEAALPAPRRRGLHSPARLGAGGGGGGDVRREARGGAGRATGDGAGSRGRRQILGRRDLPGRLGLAPRPLRHPAARAHAGGPGGADVLALRGRRAQLFGAAKVREEWHAIVERYIRQYGIFDDWGMFAYTSGAHKPWADYLVEIDVGDLGAAPRRRHVGGLGGLQARDRRGGTRHGGSITACHGATREGDAELVPTEMGSSWEVVKRIKALSTPTTS